MPTTLPGLISTAIAMAVCGYALARGRTPERVAAGAILLATALTVLVQDRVQWIDPQRRHLAIDVGLMIVLSVLASTSRRTWLIAATAAQLLACAVRFAAPFAPNVHAMAVIATENALAYVLLAALGWGAHVVAVHDHRLTTVEVAVEAARLVSLYGRDEAYDVAVRHRRQASGRRRALLERVAMVVADGGATYRGDTATRRGR